MCGSGCPTSGGEWCCYVDTDEETQTDKEGKAGNIRALVSYTVKVIIYIRLTVGYECYLWF